jgi:hypothetical protein
VQGGSIFQEATMQRTEYDFDVISGPSTPLRPPAPKPQPAPQQPQGK